MTFVSDLDAELFRKASKPGVIAIFVHQFNHAVDVRRLKAERFHASVTASA